MQDRYARENPDVVERRRKRAEGKCLVAGCENVRVANKSQCSHHIRQMPSQKPEVVNARNRERLAALRGGGEAWFKMTTANRSAKKRGLAASLTEQEVHNLLLSTQNCRYCGSELHRGNRELDHIQPLSDGGNSTLDNVQIICKNCNRAKNSDTEETFLGWVQRLIQHNK